MANEFLGSLPHRHAYGLKRLTGLRAKDRLDSDPAAIKGFQRLIGRMEPPNLRNTRNLHVRKTGLTQSPVAFGWIAEPEEGRPLRHLNLWVAMRLNRVQDNSKSDGLLRLRPRGEGKAPSGLEDARSLV